MITRLEVPAPQAHQLEVMDSPARFFMMPWGRRGGKTRVAFTAAVIGRGGDWRAGRPLYRGLTSGLDVFWILPEIPQARTIWLEEIRPRFDVVAGARVREHPQFSATAPGFGTLYVISAVPKAIKSVRGAGNRLGGVIIDEAAWMDLAHAWRAVLRPALVDNNGWAIIASTTNSGHDGNHGDDGEGDRILPSAFNRWVAEIRTGERGPEWAECHRTGYDNPLMAKTEMDALVDEYTDGSVRLEEEVFAKLLTAGAGLAFPEYQAALVDAVRPPLDAWVSVDTIGGLDWGYATPGAAYVLDVARSGERVELKGEVYFNGTPRPDWPERKTPFEVGQAIGRTWRERLEQGVLQRLPEMIFADSACFAVPDGGETIAARIQAGLIDVLGDDAPVLAPAPKGAGSPVTRKLLVHELLRVHRDATGAVMDGPALVVGNDCPHWRRTVPRLPIDPKKPEYVDTTAEDHAFDAGTYPLLALWPDGAREGAVDRATAEARAKLDALSRREAERAEEITMPRSRHAGRAFGAAN